MWRFSYFSGKRGGKGAKGEEIWQVEVGEGWDGETKEGGEDGRETTDGGIDDGGGEHTAAFFMSKLLVVLKKKSSMRSGVENWEGTDINRELLRARDDGP